MAARASEGAPRRTLREVVVERWFRAFHQRLTPRGRYLFWTVVALAIVGLDTRVTQVYVLFAAAMGLFAAACGFAALPPPRLRVAAHLPERATAGEPVALRVLVEGDGAWLGDVQVAWPVPPPLTGLLRFEPEASAHALAPGRTAEARTTLTPLRRGRYVLPIPDVRRLDPLGLAATRRAAREERALVVYPRFYRLEGFDIPLGRRYQPGGIPLSSSLGDSLEFVGTREYRPGDALRAIHWRSFARRGAPVVKEFQEEYFCRVALILDTFVPARPSREDEAGFEAGISALASVADHFSRSEHIVDILAAGPDVYEVSAGRSLAYLDNILDVLACLEPCREAPFATIGPHLFEKLARLTAVVAVLLDWDEPRAEFLRRIRALGTAVRVIVVRAGSTTAPTEGAARDLGGIERMTPAEVEARIAASRGAGAP
jgi:uncharacterized protein (DUF58 family)